jgi:Polyketide cyclase / dehydrase and lipid transport
MPPTSYTVERSATMKADPARVFAEVVDFHRWPGWSPWEDLDPDLERRYDGPKSGVGAVYSWSGNRKAGEGRMEITHADEPSSVVVDLRFLKPFKSETTTTFTFTPEGPDTRVTWTLTGPRTLMVKVMGVLTSMDKMVGKDFEKGLARLRTRVEGPAS